MDGGDLRGKELRCVVSRGKGTRAWLDSGTNANLASAALVEGLGLSVSPVQGKRRGIKTAQSGQHMVIEGVVDVGGVVGKMNVTSDADCNLVSVGKLQDQDIRVTFMDKSSGGQCILQRNQRVLKTIERDPVTRMHDVDVYELQRLAYTEVDGGVDDIRAMAARKIKQSIEGRPVGNRSRADLLDLRDRVNRLHKSLGHVNFRALASAIRDGTVAGTDLTYQDVMLVNKHVDCTACALAKWCTPGHGPSVTSHPTAPFHTISLDGLGPYTPLAVGGYSRAILATCCATMFHMGKLIKKYNGRELVVFLTEVVKLAVSKKFMVKVLRYDAGSVENGGEVKDFLRLHQIEGRPAVPEHQHQNPVERSVRTVKETIAANMVDQNSLNASYWGMCFLMAVKQRNFLPNVLCPDSSPAIEVLGHHVDISLAGAHFFGETVIVPKPGYLSGRKMAIGEPRNELARIVGYGNVHNGGWMVQRVLKPLARPVERRNPQSLVGLEDEELTVLVGKEYMPVRGADGVIEMKSRVAMPRVMESMVWPSAGNVESEGDHFVQSWSAEDLHGSAEGVQGDVSTEVTVRMEREREILERAIPTEVRRSSRDRIPNDFYTPEDRFGHERDYDWEDHSRANMAVEDHDEKVEVWALLAVRKQVITHKQTLKSSDAEQWECARVKEMKVHENSTWIQVQRGQIPQGMSILPLKWVYARKRDGAYKARIVCCGNFDPFDGPTYAPTAIKSVMWLIMALVVMFNMEVRIFDISAAFVSEPITREVYVVLGDRYYRLLRFLYGLKDAPRGFNDGMSMHLTDGGYCQSVFDPCLFFKWENSGRFMYVMVHVDDFYVAATSTDMLDEFDAHLRKKYDITDKAEGDYLGMVIDKLPDGSKVFTKPKQLRKMCDRWLSEGFEEDTRVPNTPMDPRYEEKRSVCEEKVNISEFRSILGDLIQLVDVRPDIRDAVCRAAQYTTEANRVDMDAMVRVVRYLWHTRGMGVRLRPGNAAANGCLVQLRAYADAAAGMMRNGKSRMAFGFDVVLGGAAIGDDCPQHIDGGNTGLFYSKGFTSPTVQLSSTEAEHTCIVECVKSVVLFRGVLHELHLEQVVPTVLFNDNKSAITLGNDYSGNFNRVRHFVPKVYWLLDQVKMGVARLAYLNTQHLPPDMETKPLVGEDFRRKRVLRLGLDRGEGMGSVGIEGDTV
jgi:hypothetical protein